VRVTPERDARLLAQAQAMTGTDVIRLLDLVSAALEATANGAQSRIQLELVLIKAADRQVDPSTTALLARIERLEAALQGAMAAGKAPATRPPDGATQTPATRTPTTQPVANGANDLISPQPSGSSAAPVTARKLDSRKPKSEPIPEPIPVALELDRIVASWPAVIDVVRQGNAMLAALLADARPVSLGDQSLTIAFPVGAAFLKRKAEQDDHRRMAAEAFRSVTGQALRLCYELSDEDPAEGQPDAPALSGEELVRRFVEEFDAEELESEPKPPDDHQPAG
jgi:DNA polymerase-3 subunit gamma/tau